jgi:hypothetical protein
MVLPEETRRHLRVACREYLLATRALLDLLIGEVEAASPRARAPSERAARPRPSRRRRRRPPPAR